MAARVALISPFASPSVRGNAVTVERIARGLRARGVELRVWDVSAVPEPSVEHQVAQYAPTLIHAFHAFRTGPLALRLARRAEIPLVVTITGTDANHDLFDPERAAVVRRVLEGAASITVFDPSIMARITQALPDVAARIAVVPQSAVFEDGDAAWPTAAALTRAPGPILLFSAGIRPVKNPRFPLAPLDGLIATYPTLQLLYAGPILDPPEGEALLRALQGRPWARYLGAIPHPRMRGLLEASDVALNCSVSEGGMANSVLEALALGRAVLASNIEGNRSLVEDGVTGFLFDTPEEFAAKCDRLLGDPALRDRLGKAGRERVNARFTPGQELDGYLAVYGRLDPALRPA
ncbi:MAG TPA: glycosyltransferase [Methylomirabilota bacterium]|jgi:glycosyltransferase involved in cell wall biosynthesis|nr:glycosyltransferase [Methylomirabilota bacterium]